MLKHGLKLLAFSFPVLLSFPALALIEINVGEQGIVSNSPGGNWTGTGAVNYDVSGAYGLTADVRLNLPLSSWQFGVRYGQLGLTASKGAASLAMNATTYGALIGYRIINTGLLFGPVFTYDFSGSATLQNSLSSAVGSTISASSVSGYTAGLEVGIKFPILLALEVGYGNLTASGFSTQTLGGSATNVNMSGMYGRACIGLSF